MTKERLGSPMSKREEAARQLKELTPRLTEILKGFTVPSLDKVECLSFGDPASGRCSRFSIGDRIKNARYRGEFIPLTSITGLFFDPRRIEWVDQKNVGFPAEYVPNINLPSEANRLLWGITRSGKWVIITINLRATSRAEEPFEVRIEQVDPVTIPDRLKFEGYWDERGVKVMCDLILAQIRRWKETTMARYDSLARVEGCLRDV